MSETQTPYLATAPSQNGHAPGFQVPNRTALLEFGADTEYAGAVIRCRLKIPLHQAFLFADLGTRVGEGKTEAEITEAARIFAEQILLSWNLVDDDGVPLPVTAETFLEQPFDFVVTVIAKWTDAAMGVSGPLASPSAAGALPAAPSPTTGP